MSGYAHIDVARAGGVTTITMSDPASLNAASYAMVEEMLAAFAALAGDGTRAVLLTGAGKGFCSGAKLSEELGYDAPDYDAGLGLETHYNPLMRALRDLPVPLVTAVNGAAAGIGCAMALAGDLILASEKAFFLQPFRRIGLVPDSGSSFLLTRLAGRARAMEMMLLGERLPAATALDWGMINRLVAPDRLIAEAQALAGNLAQGPTVVFREIRRQSWRAAEAGFDAMLDLERRQQCAAGRTADHREGITAFLEKRPPQFTGE